MHHEETETSESTLQDSSCLPSDEFPSDLAPTSVSCREFSLSLDELSEAEDDRQSATLLDIMIPSEVHNDITWSGSFSQTTSVVTDAPPTIGVVTAKIIDEVKQEILTEELVCSSTIISEMHHNGNPCWI